MAPIGRKDDGILPGIYGTDFRFERPVEEFVKSEVFPQRLAEFRRIESVFFDKRPDQQGAFPSVHAISIPAGKPSPFDGPRDHQPPRRGLVGQAEETLSVNLFGLDATSVAVEKLDRIGRHQEDGGGVKLRRVIANTSPKITGESPTQRGSRDGEAAAGSGQPSAFRKSIQKAPPMQPQTPTVRAVPRVAGSRNHHAEACRHRAATAIRSPAAVRLAQAAWAAGPARICREGRGRAG